MVSGGGGGGGVVVVVVVVVGSGSLVVCRVPVLSNVELQQQKSLFLLLLYQ